LTLQNAVMSSTTIDPRYATTSHRSGGARSRPSLVFGRVAKKAETGPRFATP
jgi:hypothetical protein